MIHGDELVCPVCGELTDYIGAYSDKLGTYSGKACSWTCAETLPGRGEMRDYSMKDEA